jgi:hypothetical protein
MFARRLRVVAVLAASASLLSLPLADAAPAAGNQPGKCTKLSAKAVGTTISGTLSNCSPVAPTGGSGQATFVNLSTGALRVTIKWAAGGATKATAKFSNQADPGKCGGATRVKIAGKVTGGSGAAAKTFKKGQPLTGSVCKTGATGFKLEPGSALKF